jgi:hypothetical protein
VQICRELLQRGAPGLHFYTLHLEKVRLILQSHTSHEVLVDILVKYICGHTLGNFVGA